jgi:hypothetical protein
MLNSIRVLLAVDAYFNYEIWQIDVNTDFLNGNIEEELYWYNQRVFPILRMLVRYASFNGPSMD